MATQTRMDQFALPEATEANQPIHETSNEPKKNEKTRGSRVMNGAIGISGSRNILGERITVSKNEMFDDIVNRGLRVASLARKLGISNKGAAVKDVVEQLFLDDNRRDQVMNALSVKQGKRIGMISIPLRIKRSR